MTHAELLHRMSHAEFVQWIAFYKDEERRMDEAKSKPRMRGKGPQPTED